MAMSTKPKWDDSQFLAVACSYCDSKRGEWCTREVPHPERVAAMREVVATSSFIPYFSPGLTLEDGNLT